MDKIKGWYKEAVRYRCLVYSFEEFEYILYKGFKIIKFDNGEYTIQDTRLSDLYNEVGEEHMKVLEESGFIVGADQLSYERNVKRVKDYTEKIEKLYTEMDELKISGTPKKIENCDENILKYIDLMFFYKVKVEQHESKYLKIQ